MGMCMQLYQYTNMKTCRYVDMQICRYLISKDTMERIDIDMRIELPERFIEDGYMCRET